MIPPAANGPILWAFDILGSPKDRETMAKTLEFWASDPAVAVEPVYVMSASGLKVAHTFFSESLDEIRANLTARMKRELAGVNVPGLAEPALLGAPLGSGRLAARTVARHADERHARLIAVSTRSATGLAHAIVGSFAEALILHSKVPVLSMTPEAKPLARVDHILFPTDLSLTCDRVLHELVVPLGKRFGARITLLHSTMFLFEHPEAGFGRPEAYFEFAQAEIDRQNAVLETLAHRVRFTSGLTVEAVLQKDEPDAATCILAEADKRAASLIALVSKKEGLDVPMLGSVSRKVLRHARVPTLIQHVSDGAD